VYLLGNPLVYWVSFACILSYALLKSILFITSKRRIHLPYFSDLNGDWSTKYDTAAGFFFISWALHYFPFNLMQRQLFLHHYMPALYMSTLLAGVFFELLTHVLSPRIRWPLVIICLLAIVYVYRIFIPITYAEPWTKEKCLQATWRSKWDFNCNR
jgi:dolichyl-phosphate-mannose-protein mannosyltransferase